MAEHPPSGGGEPPGSGGPGPEDWSALLDQVEEALDDAGVLGKATREALRSALGEALEHLTDFDGIDIEIEVEDDTDSAPAEEDEDALSEPSELGGPEVTVVDGGRRRNEPRSPRPRPDLRVAKRGQAAGEEPAQAPTGVHSVRILRGRAPPPRLSLAHEGRIRISSGGRQAVYRGALPRLYRLACEAGQLQIDVDGLPVEALLPGQSLDVEGVTIEVRCVEGLDTAGRYARLS